MTDADPAPRADPATDADPGAPAPTPAIIGSGFSLPATVRGNDDPVFDWLHANHPPNTDLFKGLKDRHVLADGEDIATHMVAAARQAMAEAQIAPADVDGITGYLSQSEYLTPNGLALVHQQLGLPDHAWVRPVADNFTNFFTGLSVAEAAVHAGRARNVLVVCGCNWSRMVDYHTAQAVTAGDGAGAVVVGASADPTRWRVVDEESIMLTSAYGVMFLQPEPVLPGGAPPYHLDVPIYTAPYFTLTDAGATVVRDFGSKAPVQLAQDLLARNEVAAQEVTLMGYQVSTVLSDYWAQQIKPGQYIDTLTEIGNVTLATGAINFARSGDEVTHDWLLMFSMGTAVGVGGILLHRTT